MITAAGLHLGLSRALFEHYFCISGAQSFGKNCKPSVPTAAPAIPPPAEAVDAFFETTSATASARGSVVTSGGVPVKTGVVYSFTGLKYIENQNNIVQLTF